MCSSPRRIAPGRQKPGLFVDYQFGNSANTCSNHRLTETHSLGDDISEGLLPARELADNVGGVIESRPCRILQETGPYNGSCDSKIFGQLCESGLVLPFTGYHESCVRMPGQNQCGCLEENSRYNTPAVKRQP